MAETGRNKDGGSGDSGTGNKGGEECVNRVSVRVPPFYPTKPWLWFESLESQFALANITQDTTKYHYAMSSLEPMYAELVEDIIRGPTSADKYMRLKTELVKRLTASRERQVKQLLTSEELGDRKPSQFLRHLKNLAGPGVPDDFIRTLWAGRLPSSVQTIVASHSKMTLDEVSELADQILDIVTPSPQVASASSSTPSSTKDSDPIVALTKKVEALSARMDRMSRSRQKTPASRQHRGRSSSTRSQSNYRKFPICWYHGKFGPKALKCVKPCDYAGNARGSR